MENGQAGGIAKLKKFKLPFTVGSSARNDADSKSTSSDMSDGSGLESYT